MGKTKVKESKKPLTLSKVVVYILLILLAITIIIPGGWVVVASVNQSFTEVRGYFRRRFISRTLSMRGRRRAWELTCSTQ